MLNAPSVDHGLFRISSCLQYFLRQLNSNCRNCLASVYVDTIGYHEQLQWDS